MPYFPEDRTRNRTWKDANFIDIGGAGYGPGSGGGRGAAGGGRPRRLARGGGPLEAESVSGGRKHLAESFPETGTVPGRAGWNARRRSCKVNFYPQRGGMRGKSSRGRAALVLLLTRNVSLVIPEGCGEGSQGCAVFRATPGRHNTRRSRPGRGAGNRRAQTHCMGATPTFGRTARRFPAPLPRCEFSKLYLVQGCAEYRGPWLPSWRPSRTPPPGEPLPCQTRKYAAIIPAGSECLTLRVRSSRLPPHLRRG